MKLQDIITTSLNNLMRRRSRTVLTVMGVVIGICSVVIMLSIGIGLTRENDKMLKSHGEVTQITVTSRYGGRGGPGGYFPGGNGGGGGRGQGKQEAQLDDAALDSFKQLEHVEGAAAMLSLEANTNNLGVEITAANGRYRGWANLVGIHQDDLKALGYLVDDHTSQLVREYDVYTEPNMEYNFRDTLRPDYAAYVDRYQNGFDEKTGMPKDPPPPFFDALKVGLGLSLHINDSQQDKDIRLNVVEKLTKKGSDVGFGNSNVMMRMDDMRKMIRDYRSPSERSKPIVYSQILVKVDDVNEVEKVENTIKSMGYETSSLLEWRRYMQEQVATTQMVLGGLGAISLLVAAVGITNTMVMAITERYKEIGIMKALGCYLKDIRMMFLSEAVWIGFVGGIVGGIFSLIISFVINCVANGGFDGTIMWNVLTLHDSIKIISYVPLWLVGLAIIFCAIIGLVSGYIPANNAVKIEALEAIRAE